MQEFIHQQSENLRVADHLRQIYFFFKKKKVKSTMIQNIAFLPNQKFQNLEKYNQPLDE